MQYSMGDEVHTAIHSESATESPPNNSHNFSVGDQMWQGGTNYGTIHGPAGPIKVTKSATSGPRGTACGSHNWSGGTDYGGTGCRMTDPVLTLLYN